MFSERIPIGELINGPVITTYQLTMTDFKNVGVFYFKSLWRQSQCDENNFCLFPIKIDLFLGKLEMIL